MQARIIGLGQRAAGDDGVGLAVLEALRGAELPASVELFAAPEPSALVSLLVTPARVVVVDAVLASPPGRLVELSPDALAGGNATVSTHGIGVAHAIELARLTSPEGVSRDVRILGVSIERPRRRTFELSPEVELAVRRAAARALALAGD